MLRSFRTWLTLAYALTFTLVLVLFCLSVYVVHGRHLQSDLDTALQAIARSQVAYATDSTTPEPHLHDSTADLPQGHPTAQYRIHLQILDASGGVVTRLHDPQGSSFPVDKSLIARSLTGAKFDVARHNGHNHRVLYMPFQDRNGRSYRLQVAAGLDYLEMMQRQLLRQLLLIGVLALAVITASGWLLSGLVVRPIERISDTAHEISERNLQQRIPTMATARELSRLIAVLNQTFDRLARAIDSQRRFVTDAAHELRSPLANLMTELEVALRHIRTPEEYVGVMQSNLEETHRLKRLADDLMLLSTGDQGRLDLHREPVDLNGLVAETAERFSPRAAAKGIAVRPELSLPAGTIVGDRDRLRQILDNLLENAIRYSPTGRIVRVVTQRNDQAAQVQVCDEGIGIPPQEQPYIFDRFHRMDKARSRQEGGTGLGLSICKLLVEQHGGTIAVASEPGHGTTFTVTLPLDSAAAG